MWEDVTRKEIADSMKLGFELDFAEQNSREKIGKLSKLLIGNFCKIQDRKIKIIESKGFVNYFEELDSKSNVLKHFGVFEEEKGLIFIGSNESLPQIGLGLMKYGILAFYKNKFSEKRKLVMGFRFPMYNKLQYLFKTQINENSKCFPLWKNIEN